MSLRLLVRVPRILVIVAALAALALAPEFVRPSLAGAQAATPTTIVVCGQQTAYSPASASGTGSIVIGVGGPSLTIAPGATFSGITIGSAQNVCLFATLNASGQIVSGVLIPNPAPLSGPYMTVCGMVTAYTAATASATGTITIGGATFTIAAGAAFTGATVATGTSFCLALTLNSTGGITAATAGSTLTAQPFTVCGTVTAFTAATSSAAGTITIGGAVFPIATGTTFTGTPVAVGTSFCLQVTLNASGQISAAVASVPLAATPVYGSLPSRGAGGPVHER